MGNSIGIALPKSSLFQKVLNKILFAKPPKFKTPYVGWLEWGVICSGMLMYIVFLKSVSWSSIFCLCFYVVLNSLTSSLYGFESSKSRKKTLNQIRVKYTILYFLGSFLFAVFFYRYNFYSERFLGATVITILLLWSSLEFLKAGYLLGKNQPPSDDDGDTA